MQKVELIYDKSFNDITDENGNMVIDIEAFFKLIAQSATIGDTIQVTFAESLKDG